MKRDVKKLTLSKETLTVLSGEDLRRAGTGSGWSEQGVCQTTTPTDCRACGGTVLSST